MPLLPRAFRLFAGGGQLGYESQLGNTLGGGGSGLLDKAGDALYKNLPPLVTPYIHAKPADLDGIRAAAASQGAEQGDELSKKLTADFAKITEKKMLPAHAEVLNKRFTGILSDLQRSLSADSAYFSNPSNRATYYARFQSEIGGADVQKALASKDLVDKTADHHLQRQDLLDQRMTLRGQRLSMSKGDYFRQVQTGTGARVNAMLGMNEGNALGTLDLPTVEGNAGDASAWLVQQAGLVKPSENGYSKEQLNGLDATFGESEDGTGKKLKDIWYQTKTGKGSKTTSNQGGMQLLQHMARNISRYAPPPVLNALREQGAQVVDNMSVGKLLEFTTAPHDKKGARTGPGVPIMLGGQPLPVNLGVNQARQQLEELLDTPGLAPAQREDINKARLRLNQLASQQADAEMTSLVSTQWKLGSINGTVTTHTEDVGKGPDAVKKGANGGGGEADFEQRVVTGDASLDWNNMSFTDANGVVKQTIGTTAPPDITDGYSKSVIKPDGQHKTLAQFISGGSARVFDATTLNALHSTDTKSLNLSATHLLDATGKLVLMPVAGTENELVTGSSTQAKLQVTAKVNELVKAGNMSGAVQVALNAGYKVLAGYNASADIETWDRAGLKAKPTNGKVAVGPDASDFRSWNFGLNNDVDDAYPTGVNKTELNTAFGMRPVNAAERLMLPDSNGFDDYMVKEVLVEMNNFGFTNRGGPTNKWSEHGAAKNAARNAQRDDTRANATAPLAPPKK